MYRKLALVAFALTMFGALPATHAGAAPPSISNTQVNQVFAGPFPTNKQNEPSLAMDPANAQHLVAGSNDAPSLTSPLTVE